jgi:hypothetical protein
MKTPSTAPIALLLTSGLACLVLSLLLPVTTVSHTVTDLAPDSRQPTAVTVTSTNRTATGIAIVLVVLSVASFAGAGWQVHRRRRGKAQR